MPLADLESYVGDVCAEVTSQLTNRPLVLFGHSLGALVAFELARALLASGAVPPAALVVSGRAAAHMAPRHAPIHALEADDFVTALRRLDGTPAEVLANADLMAILEPALRADFQMSEQYAFDQGAPLPVPIVAIAGCTDQEVSIEEAAGWRDLTSAKFSLHVIDGGHFFLQSHRAELIDLLRGVLEAVIA